MDSLKKGLRIFIQQIIDTSPKAYLLVDRKEPEKNRKLVQKTFLFRHYLDVVNVKHRKAITRLLLSSHALAIERLRWHRPHVARQMRLCRLCQRSVESPEHALLECDGSQDLIQLRNTFLSEVSNATLVQVNINESVSLLRRLISSRETIARTAEFTHDVLFLFDKCPMYIPV